MAVATALVIVTGGGVAAGDPVTTTTAPTTTTTVAPSTTTTSTTVAPTTTVAPETTITVAPAGTTTTAKPQAGSPPQTGVPQIPTGGGPTTTVAPGTPTTTPAPVVTGPSIDAVDADLDQLDAISAYTSAQAAVPLAEQQLSAADAVLGIARQQQESAAAERGTADSSLAQARQGMAGLALAAYTGEAYAIPGIGDANADGTVSSAADAAGSEGQDAEVLLGVIVDHTKDALAGAKRAVAGAARDQGRAASAVASAQATVASATGAVGTARATLTADVHSATVTGAAYAAANPETGSTASTTRATTTTSTTTATGSGGGPSILGTSVLTAAELAAWYATTGMASATTVPMTQLAGDYLSAGTATGVRADLAYAQSIIETGYFSFPSGGQLAGTNNNFAGIGACDSCAHGWSFPSAATGVSAQLELLEAYASTTPVATPLIGAVGVGGCCSTWTSLAGRWASNPDYGVEILTLYSEMLAWVIPQRLVAAGLLAPPSAPASLAPGTPTTTTVAGARAAGATPSTVAATSRPRTA